METCLVFVCVCVEGGSKCLGVCMCTCRCTSFCLLTFQLKHIHGQLKSGGAVGGTSSVHP